MDISAEPTSPTSPDSNLLWADDIMCLFLIRSKDLKKWLQLLWVTSQHEILVDTLPCKSQANKKFLLISPNISGSSSSMVSLWNSFHSSLASLQRKQVTFPAKLGAPWRQAWLRENIYHICPWFGIYQNVHMHFCMTHCSPKYEEHSSRAL